MKGVTVTFARDVDGAVVAHLVGEIDYAARPALRQAVAHLLAVRPAAVRIDMSEVTFMDSTGMYFFDMLHQEVGSAVRVTGLQRQPARVLGLAMSVGRGNTAS